MTFFLTTLKRYPWFYSKR